MSININLSRQKDNRRVKLTIHNKKNRLPFKVIFKKIIRGYFSFVQIQKYVLQNTLASYELNAM